MGHCISEKIEIKRGTKQGGLTSPLLFNLFYRDLVNILQASKVGVTVSSKKYNCICYADDILLCSTTPTGLQDLINTANKYINENGLRFNPTKTSCLLVGKNPFTSMPEWVIDGTPINIVDKISYLGSEFGDLNGDAHCVQRVRKATRAFFGLQGAGVKYPGVQPHIALEFYNTAIRSVIGYGCSSIYITKKNINHLEKLQNKLIRQCIGLHTNSHITPVLKAMGISPISTSVAMESLDLIKKCVLNNSIARDFYCKTLFMPVKSIHGKTLSDRVLQFVVNNNINILKYIFDKKYSSNIKNCINRRVKDGEDGTVDSIRGIFNNYGPQENTLLNLILKSF